MKMQNTDDVSIAQECLCLGNSLHNVKCSHSANRGTEKMGPWEVLLAAYMHTHAQ